MLGSLVRDDARTTSLRQASQDLRLAWPTSGPSPTKINEGEGTLGALVVDPTVYDRLAAVLDGASRSLLLRSLIRSLGRRGPQRK